jgi:hypothetical protein
VLLTEFAMRRSLRLSIPLLPLVLLCGAPALAEVQLPLRKAGLWDIKVDHEGGKMPAVSLQQCTSEAVDREFTSEFAPSARQNCSKTDIRKTATGYVADSVCTAAGATVTSHAETSGDFNSAYTVTVTTHSEGGRFGTRDGKITMAATWTGACKEGQKPGDVVMPGGFKMNMRDLEKFKAMVPK